MSSRRKRRYVLPRMVKGCSLLKISGIVRKTAVVSIAAASLGPEEAACWSLAIGAPASIYLAFPRLCSAFLCGPASPAVSLFVGVLDSLGQAVLFGSGAALVVPNL